MRSWLGWVVWEILQRLFYFLPVGMGANKLAFSDAPRPAGTLLSASGLGIDARHLHPSACFSSSFS